MNEIIKLPYVAELEKMNGITLKGDNNSFGDLEYLIDTEKVLIKESEELDEVECEFNCGNDCHRCAVNFNTHIRRIEISRMFGKKKLVFEAYSGDQVGDCFSDLYFIGVETIGKQ